MLTVLRSAHTRSFLSGCRAATGRSLLLHLARRLNPGAVFMPCFVPEGVIKPFLAAGVDVIFYRLTPQLYPDIEHLRELLPKSKASEQLLVFTPPGTCSSRRPTLTPATDMNSSSRRCHPLISARGARAKQARTLSSRGFHF